MGKKLPYLKLPRVQTNLQDAVERLAKLSDIEEITDPGELPRYQTDRDPEVRRAAETKLKQLRAEREDPG